MTTNNLIGYDPLAWMDGAEIEETPIAPVKKATKPRTKAKAEPVAEVVEETIVEAVEETPEELPIVLEKTDEIDGEIAGEIVDENELDIDVSIDENGDIEITVDNNDDSEISIEIAVEEQEMHTEPEFEENAVLDALVEEASEMTEEESVPEVEIMPEEIAVVEPLVELRADASLKTIAELYDTFKRVLAAHDAIEINASDVTTIDTATFQLLVSLKKDAPRLNKTINIIYPSARFIESAKLLDLLTVLEVSE
jgi:ABC-type transporter Mla MlaB component